MKKFCIFSLIVILFNTASAKDPGLISFTYKEQLKSRSIDEPTIKNRAISFNLAGAAPIIGITYEQVVSGKISTEIGLGLVGAGLGIKYFPTSIKMNKLMFHTGATVATVFPEAIYSTGRQNVPVIISTPLGISYYAPSGLNFGIDIGPGVRFDPDGPAFTPYGNIKIGRRF